MFATAHEAESTFYEALRRADAGLLMQVWADDEEIVCVHPGGLRLIGHDAVQESWQQILAKGPLDIRPARPLVLSSLMSSTHTLIEQLTFSTPEGRQTAHCYCTNVYQKGATGWRMVLHHASNAPSSAGLLDLQDVPGTLH
ncbi:YybH family protein [Candidimonas nitroreducens]|uniref:DUF4440 domain-containing protein n=1 Tax=Candidimonas nitroreducens TaxID=683354 RepID=A0A225MK36_9BURK|nr:nuclear transport factor 2 family protein [Candidimonas nitroreducens]OWT61757.1 DUF4440 domain-containing protein [Candidimonas nitroreducens]